MQDMYAQLLSYIISSKMSVSTMEFWLNDAQLCCLKQFLNISNLHGLKEKNTPSFSDLGGA